MQVILCDDVENLGEMGATVKVAAGYARNYLLPRRLAVQADSASAKQIEHEMRIIKRREEKRRTELTQVAREIEAITVDIEVRSGEGDRIFGSVTSANISDRLKELGREISRKNILLAEPIKSLGIFLVPVKLGSGVEAKLKVLVSPLAEQLAEQRAPVAAKVEEAPEEAASEE